MQLQPSLCPCMHLWPAARGGLADVSVDYHPSRPAPCACIQMFNCREVGGVSYLVADMRLQCYDSKWIAVALYAAAMGIVYIVGLPVAVFVLLYRRRALLFGDSKNDVVREAQDKYGFLYR